MCVTIAAGYTMPTRFQKFFDVLKFHFFFTLGRFGFIFVSTKPELYWDVISGTETLGFQLEDCAYMSSLAGEAGLGMGYVHLCSACCLLRVGFK